MYVYSISKPKTMIRKLISTAFAVYLFSRLLLEDNGDGVPVPESIDRNPCHLTRY